MIGNLAADDPPKPYRSPLWPPPGDPSAAHKIIPGTRTCAPDCGCQEVRRTGKPQPTTMLLIHAPSVGDLTREPVDYPADRALRLQALARGDEGECEPKPFNCVSCDGSSAREACGGRRFLPKRASMASTSHARSGPSVAS